MRPGARGPSPSDSPVMCASGAACYACACLQFCAALPTMLYLSPLPTQQGGASEPSAEPLCFILHALLQRSAEKSERDALVACAGHWRVLSWLRRAATTAANELTEARRTGPSAHLLGLVTSAAGALLTLLCVDNAIVEARSNRAARSGKKKKKKKAKAVAHSTWVSALRDLASSCVTLGAFPPCHRRRAVVRRPTHGGHSPTPTPYIDARALQPDRQGWHHPQASAHSCASRYPTWRAWSASSPGSTRRRRSPLPTPRRASNHMGRRRQGRVLRRYGRVLPRERRRLRGPRPVR